MAKTQKFCPVDGTELSKDGVCPMCGYEAKAEAGKASKKDEGKK